MTALLRLENVSQRFVRRRNTGERIAGWLGAGGGDAVVHAVAGVDLEIGRGEVVGLVGESGCGKSTLGRIATGFYVPTAGRALFDGEPVAVAAGRRARKTTTRIQMIYQDPFASLNPRMRIADIVAEGPLHHGLVSRADAPAYVSAMLARVGLDPEMGPRFPHQFSGGQRQRVAIARALAMKPELIVCDEPVASLDVSIQAQILNLFMDLRAEFGLAYLFISHDLGVVRHVSDRVAIMYLGRIVEEAPREAIFARATHPYTEALLEAVPRLGVTADFRPVAGEIPSPLAPPPGCHFHPRCVLAREECRRVAPRLAAVAPDHRAACLVRAPEAAHA